VTRPRCCLAFSRAGTIASAAFRDRLDRYGELELVAALARLVAEPHDGVVAADDPLTASIAEGHPAVIRYGIDDPRWRCRPRPVGRARTCAAGCLRLPRGRQTPQRPLHLRQRRSRLGVAARASAAGSTGPSFDLCQGTSTYTVSRPAGLPNVERTAAGSGRPGRASEVIAEGLALRGVRALPAPARRQADLVLA
jgi:hypothetical protein